MKKYLSLLIILILCLSVAISLPVVQAESTSYYYIKDSNAIMTLESGYGTILLPKTYYVESTNETDKVIDGITYKVVKYKNCKGLVNSAKLSVKKSDTVKGSPYFSDTDLKTNPQDKKTTIYYDAERDAPLPQTFAKDEPIDYIGVCATDTNLYYVAVNINSVKYFGFVNKAELSKVIIETQNPNAENPDSIANEIPPPNGSGNEDTKPTNNLLRILLITAICILSVIIIFLIFKPTKPSKTNKRSSQDFYENDNRK